MSTYPLTANRVNGYVDGMADDYIHVKERNEIAAQLARYMTEDQRARYATPRLVVDAIRDAINPRNDHMAADFDIPTAAEVLPEDIAAALRLFPNLRLDLEYDEVKLIEAVLDRGWTWERLGAALGGRSRQSMQQRYRRIGGTRNWGARVSE